MQKTAFGSELKHLMTQLTARAQPGLMVEDESQEDLPR
jgi:hypothetical protein